MLLTLNKVCAITNFTQKSLAFISNGAHDRNLRYSVLSVSSQPHQALITQLGQIGPPTLITFTL